MNLKRMKKYNIHGIISYALISVATFSALIYLFSISLIHGLIYLILFLTGSGLIMGRYCTKCPCRETNCGHVLPGKLTKYFPKRPKTEYNSADHFTLILAILMLFAYPQYFLFQNIYAFVVFWCMSIIALLEINFLVCTKCENTKCKACKNKALRSKT